nr:hypothetical protein [Tanacetum cinerariifolium]
MAQAPKGAKAIQVVVQKLVEAGITREVYYHDWLSNPVMIQLAESDEEKTAFHTGQGVYCYTKIPYGLKNAGATYQRLVDKAFDNQIGQNIEVYIDNLVVKSHIEAEMLRDIGETFRTLRKINMKLNPKKCTFGAVEGMFLGYKVTLEGIKPYPDKTEFVLQLPSGTSLQATKEHLTELPLLVAPKPKEELIVYLSASYRAISAVLMTERGTVHMPVYFVSRALQGPELNYTLMEKQVLSLVFAAKRPRRTIKKMERHAGRTQYYIPAKDVGERTDGLSFVDGSGAGLILTSPEGTKFTYALRFQFAASNNKAEYEALIAGTLPSDRKEARKLRIKARQYELLEEGIHERSCSMHAGPRSVVAKSIRLGYYWPTMHQDLRDMIRPSKVKVAMDYFTKWIEAKAVATITDSHVAVIPAKIRMPTYRTAAVDVVHNDEELRLNLDFLEERRERAAIREA